jgi:hypothetical protein
MSDWQEAMTPHKAEVGFCGWDSPNVWKELVLKLYNDINGVGADYRIGQVKEKFGGLRFYIDIVKGTPEQIKEIDRLIGEAENKSYDICLVCGIDTKGARYDKYNGRTKCLSCFSKENKDDS